MNKQGTDAGKTRESNFELLRMLAGMAVVVLHFNYFPAGGGALANATGSRYYVLLFLEALCACAVNVFLLISGYFNGRSEKIRLGRLVELLLQTICIAVAVNLISCAIHHNFSVKQILGSFIPANYYVILYIGTMLAAPFINRLMNSLSEKGLSILMIIVFAVFSVYSTGVDVLKEITGSDWNGLSSIGLEGSMNGYTIVNFIMVYMIGAWMRKTECMKRFSLAALIAALIGCVLAIMAWRRFLPQTAWTYNNPIIILEACILIGIFGKIRLKSKVINTIAPAAFTCYLIHGSILGLLNDRISNAQSLPEVLGLLAACVIGIYAISVAVMKIWELLAGAVRKLTGNKIQDIQVG